MLDGESGTVNPKMQYTFFKPTKIFLGIMKIVRGGYFDVKSCFEGKKYNIISKFE